METTENIRELSPPSQFTGKQMAPSMGKQQLGFVQAFDKMGIEIEQPMFLINIGKDSYNSPMNTREPINLRNERLFEDDSPTRASSIASASTSGMKAENKEWADFNWNMDHSDLFSIEDI